MTEASFERAFRAGFAAWFEELFRYLDRSTGDPEFASDLAQEALVRLYRRGMMPENVRVWLLSVAINQLRDERRRRTRQQRLLGKRQSGDLMADPPPAPDGAMLKEEARRSVQRALESMSVRDQQLLLLRHEGLSYRELATTLDLTETSVGTLLVRARAAFRAALQGRHGSSV